jgi:hypothetical protein
VFSTRQKQRWRRTMPAGHWPIGRSLCYHLLSVDNDSDRHASDRNPIVAGVAPGDPDAMRFNTYIALGIPRAAASALS